MLEGEPQLTLELLNRATLAWLELEYNRKVHAEIGTTPFARFLEGPSVLRPSPSSEELRRAFRREETRTQRRSDGTISVDGVRFEIPSRYRTLARPRVRWASWDLSSADLVDARTGVFLASLLPLDKEKNADGRRRVIEPEPDVTPAPSGIAPLLRELMNGVRGDGDAASLCALASKGNAMNQKLLSAYGLKFHPFRPDVPVEALHATPTTTAFCRRVEFTVGDGGFVMVTGEPGAGKSVTLRLLAAHLRGLRDVVVGTIDHPQSRVSDFYRELGDIFGVAFPPHNRWVGFKSLRMRWNEHISTTLMRPVLIIDEAQEVLSSVFSELRVLTSKDFDSRSLLCVVFAGDGRLTERLRQPDLLPLGSRVRRRLALEHASRDELCACLDHLLDAAGNPGLMSTELKVTFAEHAAGNYRVMMNIADELLAAAVERELPSLDEKLYFDVFQPAQKPPRAAAKKR